MYVYIYIYMYIIYIYIYIYIYIFNIHIYTHRARACCFPDSNPYGRDGLANSRSLSTARRACRGA